MRLARLLSPALLVAAATPALALDAKVTLTRGACEARCPVYAVSVAGDGAVAFEGRHFVRKAGRATRRIGEAKAAAALRPFGEAAFRDAPETIAPGEAACGEAKADGQRIEIEAAFGTSVKRVTLDTRCTSETARRIADLARGLDEAAATKALLRGR
jgi:catechol 2,3-dioxygenase-like lactoylglutathione lyase family enzyme